MAEVPLKPSVRSLEYLAEIAPCPVGLQHGEQASAAKTVNQLRADRDGRHGIALLDGDQPSQS